jgi:hypothetical protein
MIFRNEAFYHYPAPERLPSQPNDLTRYPQIVECSNTGFGVGARKSALKRNFAVVRSQSFDNPLAAVQIVDR